MRFLTYLSVFLTAFVLLTPSCSNGSNKDSQTSDSISIKVNEVIPLSEISINGKWVSKDNLLYPILEFKGKSSVMVNAIIFPVALSYVRDEEFIRIKGHETDLLFEIISEDSIKGLGFAEGIWIKEK